MLYMHGREKRSDRERKEVQTTWISTLYIILNDYSKFPKTRLVDQMPLI